MEQICVVMIGDSDVGKSCLLKKFSQKNFELSQSYNQATIGVDFVHKVVRVDDREVRLQVWDTAGQERYHSITKQYFAGAMGAVICYDSTNAKSFKNAESWLTQYRGES